MRRLLTAVLMPLGVAGSLASCGSNDEPVAQAERGAPPAKVRQGPPAGKRRQGPPPGKGPNRAVVVAEGIAEPRRVEDSGERAAKAVEKTLGREITPDQPVVIGARCDAGNCVARYRSIPRGGGAGLLRQGDILRRIFSQEGVRSVILYVHHQSVGTPRKSEVPAFATTTCRRTDHPRFRWERIKANDIPRVCRYTHVAGGKQRSLLKRGLLTEREASLGKGD